MVISFLMNKHVLCYVDSVLGLKLTGSHNEPYNFNVKLKTSASGTRGCQFSPPIRLMTLPKRFLSPYGRWAVIQGQKKKRVRVRTLLR